MSDKKELEIDPPKRDCSVSVRWWWKRRSEFLRTDLKETKVYGSNTDFQRRKLYNAESGIGSIKCIGKFEEGYELKRYCRKVSSSNWLTSAIGEDCDLEIRAKIKDQSSRAVCCDQHTIKFPPKRKVMWSKAIVLHEISHCIVERADSRHAPHGRLFARVYLELVKHFLGDDCYEYLKAGYREENVKYHPMRTRGKGCQKKTGDRQRF